MSIFENEEFIGKLKKLKGEVLELCGKFRIYNK